MLSYEFLFKFYCFFIMYWHSNPLILAALWIFIVTKALLLVIQNVTLHCTQQEYKRRTWSSKWCLRSTLFQNYSYCSAAYSEEFITTPLDAKILLRINSISSILRIYSNIENIFPILRISKFTRPSIQLDLSITLTLCGCFKDIIAPLKSWQIK